MRSYPGKMLLFGEYVLLLGAPALATPTPAFSGCWIIDPNQPFGDALMLFAKSQVLRDVGIIDVDWFEKDIKNGLRFHSNIPHGYGLGSSGALVAAVYDRFALEKTTDLQALRTVLGRMESYFHGQSSGIDPLTTFLNDTLYIPDINSAHQAKLATWSTPPPRVFLVDTGAPRQTGPLVARFMQQCKEPHFRAELDQTWIKYHQQALDAWMHADESAFWPALRQLSAAQLHMAEPLIPEHMIDIWKKLLTEENFALKICGAGGGGFLLGFGQAGADWRALSQLLKLVFPLEAYGH
jgi:mevalonate kinase